MNLDKLKEAARKFEQREEWRRAIDVYLQAIREAEETGGEGTQDPALYNRVGDLELKAGESPAALRAYEQAAELYADQGFFNNAIALCGKILRVNPSRTATYLRLAQLHARKNFVGEAKKNLLEYLDRMNGVGQLEEAFSAVKLFADQFSGNPDIRLMLVELLRASSRTEEAKEQLEKLATELEARGDSTGARRTRERLHAIDEAGTEPSWTGRNSSDLVFLDTSLDASSTRRKDPAPPHDLVVNASEELVSPPGAMPEAPHGASSLDAEAAGDAGDPLGLQIEGSTLATDLPWEPEGSVEGLDIITQDPLARDEGIASTGELPMLDLDDNALRLEDVPEGDGGALLVEEGPGEASLEGDAPGAIEATEFDDVDAPAEPRAVEPPAVPVSRRPPDVMFLQLSDSMEGAAAALGMEPGAALLEQARRCLDAGDRNGGIAALEEALRHFETEARWDEAMQVCMDLLRLDSEAIDRYQKQVELAYRAGGRPVLVSAYLELADALVRRGSVEHAAHVYQRVLEHDPGNPQAASALDMLAPPAEPEPAPPARSAPAAVPEAESRTPPPAPSGEYVDLGALILDDQQARDTRMRIGQKQPIEDEDQAFHEALSEFKRGIEANLDAEDFQSHYDLGIAFKEMGLIDEAIAQFQKALRSPEGRLKTSEQLGASFFDKGQYAISEAVLRRAVDGLPGADDEKIGLLYWLGRALEAQGRGREALPLYERALAVDIRFLDLGARVTRLGAEASR
jgi:tetratricopeptide (TPR) repeat protein